jgi:hypothetical protein
MNLVVVDDFDLVGVSLSEAEADSVLVVDANGVVASPIAT